MASRIRGRRRTLRAIGPLVALALLAGSGCRAHVKVYRVPAPKSDTSGEDTQKTASNGTAAGNGATAGNTGQSSQTAKPGVTSSTSFANDKQGLYYALPKTVLIVKVPVGRTEVKPGPYQKFALSFFPYLSPDDVVNEEGLAFKLGDATMETKAIADPANVFLVKLNPEHLGKFWRWFNTNSFDMKLTEQGIATSIAAEATDESGPFIAQLFKTGAALYGQAVTGGIASLVEPSPTAKTYEPCPESSPPLDAVERRFAEQMPDDNPLKPFYCASNSEGRDAIQVVNEHDPWIKPFLSYFRSRRATIATPEVTNDLKLFLGAGASFDEIQQLVEKRTTLLSAVMGVADKGAFQAALDALNARVDALLQDFVGLTSRVANWWSGTFWVVPQGAAAGSPYETFGPLKTPTELTLFTFSAKEGICKDTPPTNPEYRVVIPQEVDRVTCTEKERRTVALTQGFESQQMAQVVAAAQANSSVLAKQPNGIYYRVPASARFAVRSYLTKDKPTVLTFNEFEIAQYGPVSALPTTTGGSKVRYQLDSYPATGAVKNLIVTKNSLIDPATVGTIGDSAVAALKAKQETDKAGEPQVESEESKLKSQLRIRLLQECLADSSKSFCKDLIQ